MNVQQLFDTLFSLFRDGKKIQIFYVEKRLRFGKYHVLHLDDCELLPDESGRVEIGRGNDVDTILTQANQEYENVKLCQECCESDKPELKA